MYEIIFLPTEGKTVSSNVCFTHMLYKITIYTYLNKLVSDKNLHGIWMGFIDTSSSTRHVCQAVKLCMHPLYMLAIIASHRWTDILSKMTRGLSYNYYTHQNMEPSINLWTSTHITIFTNESIAIFIYEEWNQSFIDIRDFHLFHRK